MPSGKIHLTLWKRWSWVIVPLTFMGMTLGPTFALGILIGYGLGYYFDPDWDQISITGGEGRILRHLKLVGSMMLGFFLPYAYLFKHRGISHMPVVGTITRWMWIGLIAFLFFRTGLFLYVKQNTHFIYGILVGQSYSDFIHILADQGLLKYRKIRRK